MFDIIAATVVLLCVSVSALLGLFLSAWTASYIAIGFAMGIICPTIILISDESIDKKSSQKPYMQVLA